MMLSDTEHKRFIIFAQKASERDYLRNIVFTLNNTKVVCFERESICFDNLTSINPQVILIRTDSIEIIWRFIFALQVFHLNCRIIILSDQLTWRHFNRPGINGLIHCIPLRNESVRLREAIEKVTELDNSLANTQNDDYLVGKSNAIRYINNQLPNIIASSDPIMITGEDGTGKEKLARLIVGLQKKRSVFIKIDCSQIVPNSSVENESLVEQFYSVFSKIECHHELLSDSIVFFLDKIHLLKKNTQSEILPILDNGGPFLINHAKAGDELQVRFIATSDVEINNLAKRADYRKAFLYRLNVLPIHMPPLRQRREDVPLLIDYFIINTCKRMKRSLITPSRKVLDKLLAYDWPGNVEELQRLIERMAISGDESHIFSHNGIQDKKQKSTMDFYYVLDTMTLPNTFEIKNYLSDFAERPLKIICDKFVSRTEKIILQKALESTSWNRKRAAELLHISYKSILNKIKMYDIL